MDNEAGGEQTIGLFERDLQGLATKHRRRHALVLDVVVDTRLDIDLRGRQMGVELVAQEVWSAAEPT